MFGRKSDVRSRGAIESLIGAGTRVEGCVYFSGGLRIDGEVKGSVLAVEGALDSVLILSEQARVEGAVSVASLISNGTIVGPVTVTKGLELQPKSKIVGDVQYVAIEMHQGAVIEGRLVHLADKNKFLELKSEGSN